MTCRGLFQARTPDLDNPDNPNWALETGPTDLPIMTDMKTLVKGKKKTNYKDRLPNHSLKVHRKSCQLPKGAHTSSFGARKSNRQLPTCNWILF